MGTTTLDDPIETFIARWSASEGAERANFQHFAVELCDLIAELGARIPNPRSTPQAA